MMDGIKQSHRFGGDRRRTLQANLRRLLNRMHENEERLQFIENEEELDRLAYRLIIDRRLYRFLLRVMREREKKTQ